MNSRYVQLTGQVVAQTFPGSGRAVRFLVSLATDHGSLTCVFLGRRNVTSLRIGTWVSVRGVLAYPHGVPTIVDPDYTIINEQQAHASV